MKKPKRELVQERAQQMRDSLLAAAIALFALADLAGNWFTGTAAGDQFAAMFGTVSIGVLGYAAILAQVCLVAMVTGATSHRTVNRTIETIQ